MLLNYPYRQMVRRRWSRPWDRRARSHINQWFNLTFELSARAAVRDVAIGRRSRKVRFGSAASQQTHLTVSSSISSRSLPCPTAVRPASLPVSRAWLNLSQSWDYPRGLLVLLLWMWLIAFQRAAEFISLNVRLRREALEAVGHRWLMTLTCLNRPMAAQTCTVYPLFTTRS